MLICAQRLSDVGVHLQYAFRDTWLAVAGFALRIVGHPNWLNVKEPNGKIPLKYAANMALATTFRTDE
jgi:hypothetical protein